MDRTVQIPLVVLFGLLFFMLSVMLFAQQEITTLECVNMNGEEIHPEPDLCNWSCNGRMESPHMQAHLDETCRCCKAKGIDYSEAKEYQPRVYVINPDGSQGEDRTCAYYPEAAGCS